MLEKTGLYFKQVIHMLRPVPMDVPKNIIWADNWRDMSSSLIYSEKVFTYTES